MGTSFAPLLPEMLKKLLLVEPDPDLADALDGALRAAGYSIVTVPDAVAAAARLRAGPPPDLLVIDVTLPGARADDLVAVLDAEPRFDAVRVVIVSSRVGLPREIPRQTVAVLIGTPLREQPLIEIIGRLTGQAASVPLRRAI